MEDNKDWQILSDYLQYVEQAEPTEVYLSDYLPHSRRETEIAFVRILVYATEAECRIRYPNITHAALKELLLSNFLSLANRLDTEDECKQRSNFLEVDRHFKNEGVEKE